LLKLDKKLEKTEKMDKVRPWHPLAHVCGS